ncbi:sensor histidine kinase [Sporolactobacillus sp. KGMB 08714]|uniref:sensor histidine kinase n=1 Tax=Sporolactobacillus sp. KGMB 08714 TaxID=3064704 RepID=UPI002FBE0D3C
MKAWIKAFKKQKDTMLFRMNFWFILILLVTVLFIGVSALAVVSYQLYQGTRQDVSYVEHQLIATARQKNPDWNEAVGDALYAQHPDFYVHIQTPDGKTIYSKGSEGIAGSNQYLVKLSLITSFFINNRLIPIYHQTVSYGGYTFDIYVRMLSIRHFIKTMVKVLIFCTALGILFGSLAIYQISRKLSRPLTDVTLFINRLTRTKDLEQRVPLPAHPREVRDLAVSFNHLMAQLERQIEREKRFVSDASHELRTPLAAIRGHVELIQRHGTDHPEVIRQSIHFVDHESKRMQRLIDQLLMIARLDRKAKALFPVDLSIIAGNVIADYASEVEQTLTADIADNVCAPANEDYVHQIIVSLLGNARKYTPAGGWIKIIVNSDRNYSYIRVQNSGSRIPDEEKEKIFNRFYRLDKSRSSEQGGTGLGLAIVRQLVEIENGRIWVQDMNLPGSEFVVRFGKWPDGGAGEEKRSLRSGP